MKVKTLDIGCRWDPKGDVNIDIDKKTSLKKGKIKNFILADGQFLPFKNKSFSCVYSRHVLEHIENPLVMLEEIKRVCNGKLTLFIPSAHALDHDKHHLFSWTPFTLKNLLNRIFEEEIKIAYAERKSVIRRKVGRWLPYVWLNTFLSFFGVRPEICAVVSWGDSVKSGFSINLYFRLTRLPTCQRIQPSQNFISLR